MTSSFFYKNILGWKWEFSWWRHRFKICFFDKNVLFMKSTSYYLSKMVSTTFLSFLLQKLCNFENLLIFGKFLLKKCWRHQKFLPKKIFSHFFQIFIWFSIIGVIFSSIASFLTVLEWGGNFTPPQQSNVHEKAQQE